MVVGISIASVFASAVLRRLRPIQTVVEHRRVWSVDPVRLRALHTFAQRPEKPAAVEINSVEGERQGRCPLGVRECISGSRVFQRSATFGSPERILPAEGSACGLHSPCW
ncbi:AEL241Wp [Anopheles sinensis]|uniref:AEL241Wp n=1 Tax=Anopheles sinensis TaxID=74873 RepID=A0A084WIQ8_ANOSI|nr:AEL241Wp [Anopheles sinensis]